MAMVSTEQSAPIDATPSPEWNDALLRDPHHVADKRSRVQKMFAAIAPSYDLNNRLHSLWMDQRWRKKAVRVANPKATDRILDVACGTGDLSLKFFSTIADAYGANGKVPEAAQVLGLDFTFQMLPIARLKADRLVERDRRNQDVSKPCIQFINGDAQSLPLAAASADVVSIAFGIRNVQEPAAAIHEFYRVLRPGGRLIILEFSLPTNPILRGLYNFYFRKILPRTATLISGDKTGAYKYLPESVNTFIGREEMMRMMTEAGFTSVEQHPLTFGVCVCYRGIKQPGNGLAEVNY